MGRKKPKDTNQAGGPGVTKKAEFYAAGHACPFCNGTKTVLAPAAPGFEGRPTFAMPCQHCK